MAVEFIFTCPLPNGLHARPASMLEEIARHCAAEITLTNERTGRTANMKSVLAMVGADVRFKDRCRIVVQGVDEREALETMAVFLKERFPHCDEVLPAVEVGAGGIRLPPGLRDAGVTVRQGTPAVGGIGQGRIVPIAGFALPPGLPLKGVRDVVAERCRVDEGLDALEKSYAERLARPAGLIEKAVLQAHRTIARDPEFRSRLLAAIQDNGCTAAGALAEAESHFTAMLNATGRVLLRERALDVQDVCRQLLRHLYGAQAALDTVRLDNDSIVTAESLTPSQLLELNRRCLKGLALGHTGNTSHTVILARSFGIPTLTGMANITGVRWEQEEAILDAELGVLLTGLTDTARRYYSLERRRLEQRYARLRRFIEQPGQSQDGVRLEIAANVSTADEVAPAFAAGAESIGLFRTEMLFMDRTEAPTEDEQFEAYRRALATAGGRTVIIRTLDVGGDKPLPYLNLPLEENPFLGCRAVRLYPRIEGIFRAQIRALLRASPHGRLKVMVPMIAHLTEARWVKKIVAEEQAQLTERKAPHDQTMALGAMIEVPAAAFELDVLCRELDFFSIGSNDLLHYFTATDRSCEPADALDQPIGPAFLRLLKKIADEIRAQGKWIGLCGEMGGQPRFLPLLVGLGLDEISMAVPSLARIKAALAQLSAADCRMLFERAVSCPTGEDVAALLEQSAAREMAPLLETDLVLLDSEAVTKAEAVKEICDQLYVTGRADCPRDVEEAIWRRESAYSTGFGHGFAIPHCKTSAVSAHSLAMLKLRQPIPWDSVDGQPVSVVLLLAIRESDQATAHLKIFSRLARQLMHEDFREQLFQARDASTLVGLLRNSLGH
jgi:fructose-specific PTS system IIA-like component